MDVCSANYKSAFESVSGFCESSKETIDRAFDNPGGHFVDDLAHHLSEYLNIQDGEDLTDKNNSNTLKEDGHKDTHANDSGIRACEKVLIKCATFPCSSRSASPSELVQEGDTAAELLAHNTATKSADVPCSRSISLPTPRKIVSAIKGSREKEGRPLRKLSVTWAPDVYDPVPTAVSHVPNKGQRHRSDNKKNGKNKQKSNGKSSRGSKGKDKKQGRKHGGSSKRSLQPLDVNDMTTCSRFQPLEDDNITPCSSELRATIVDFDIGSSPDSFCGSSFLKESVTKLHFPVAEAT